MHKEERNEEGRREVFAVMTVNGGVIDGIAGIYDDKDAAGHVAMELRAMGYDVDVVPRRLGTVTVRVTAGGDVAVVKTAVADGDGAAPVSGQVIRSGRTVAEAEASAKADMSASPLTTLFGKSDEILVSTDDSGRTVVEFMGSAAERIAENTRLCCLPTRSAIKNGSGKAVGKWASNLAGQIGEAAGQVFLHGRDEGWERYVTERNVRNANPFAGDGGVDALTWDGAAIDFKTTLRRSSKAAPERFSLVVPPKERHEDTVYVMIIADKVGYDHFRATIVGVCPEADLPTDTTSAGVFAGKYVVPATALSAPSTLAARS